MPTTTDAHIGERVHHMLWTQGRSQRGLATYLGLNETTLSRKIRGNRPWSVDEVLGAAAYLDCRLADLLPDPPAAWRNSNHPLRNTEGSLRVADASGRRVGRSGGPRCSACQVTRHPIAV